MLASLAYICPKVKRQNLLGEKGRKVPSPMHSTLRSLAYLPSAENFDSIRRHVLLLRGKVLHNDTVILCTSGEVNSGRAVGKSIKTAGNCQDFLSFYWTFEFSRVLTETAVICARLSLRIKSQKQY